MNHEATTGTSDRVAGPESPPGASGDETFVAALLDAAPDALVVIDEAGTIQLVNAQVERLFRYPRAELIGEHVELLVPEQSRAIHRAHRTRYRADPAPRPMGSDLALHARRADGHEFPVEISLSPVDTEAGQRIIAAIRDVTNRLERERHATVVRHAIDRALDGILIADPDTLEFTFVSHRLAELVGYPVDELLGLTPLHLLPDLTTAELESVLEPVLSDAQESVTVQAEALRKDGRTVPIEISVNRPPSSDVDEVRPIVAVVRDTSSRLAAERALRASEAAFRAAFDAAPVGMAIAGTNLDGPLPLLNVNQALCTMLGYTRAELLTMTVADITHPDDLVTDSVVVGELLDGRHEVLAAEKRYVRADGSVVWAWLHVSPLVSGSGELDTTLAHIVDLTDKRKADTAKELQRQRIEALAEVRAAALADWSNRDLLELVCRRARSLVNADTAYVAEVDVNREQLRPIAFDTPDTRNVVPEVLAIDGPLNDALRGHPVLSCADEDRLGEGDTVQAALEAVGSVVVVPIESSGTVDMMLFVGAEDPTTFGPDDVEIVRGFATEAATALQLNQVRAQESRLRLLQDRERLARDLHDVVIQQLFGAGMGLQAVLDLERDDRVADRIRDTIIQLDQTVTELRSAIFHLSTPVELTNRQQIVGVIDRATPRLGFEPTVRFIGEPSAITEPVIEQLLPTLSEALSNASRHADATRVDITITIDDYVRLVVADDGVGLDPDLTLGNGIVNMEARAERLAGTASLEPNPSGGTILTWTAVATTDR